MLVGPRMAVSFGVELEDGLVDGAIKVIRTGESPVSEVMPLQVAPYPFNIVELRRVFRQPLDPEPVSPQGERRAACFAGVDRTVVAGPHFCHTRPSWLSHEERTSGRQHQPPFLLPTD